MRVHEAFYSLQGEGEKAGMPAYFLRLAGCNQYCHFCDSKDTWSQKSLNGGDIQTIADNVCSIMDAHKTNNLIITGGEPLIYADGELQKLIRAIMENNFDIDIFMETSGYSQYQVPMSELQVFHNVHIHLSPKLGRNLPMPFFIEEAEEIRFPVACLNDITLVKRWILEHAYQISHECPVYLSPIIEANDNIRNIADSSFFNVLVESIKYDSQFNFRLSVQQHKWWGIK